MLIERPPDELSKDELERVDNLLASARRTHHWAFILSGLSLLLSSLEQFTELPLPIVEFAIPALHANMAIYVLVLVLTLASERLFNIARPWLKMDKRRPPFAWIALGSDPRGSTVTLWLVLPVVVCSIATAVSVPGDDTTGLTLSFAGVLVVLLPHTAEQEWYLIRRRLDHRGGPATFSIWLLYWYRLVRTIVTVAFFFLPVLAVIPKWRNDLVTVVKWCGFIMVALVVGRFVAGTSPVYRRIDRIGLRFGFPAQSEHYK